MADPILTARKKRQRHADHLKARSGEPQKPSVEEIYKLGNPFLNSLRKVLAN